MDDAGPNVGDARSDAERDVLPSDATLAPALATTPAAVSAAVAPSMPVPAARAPQRSLAKVAAQLRIRDPRGVPATDTAPEPPAALLRAATRGRRQQGAAPRIVRSRDGLDLWVVVGRGASHWTSHLHLRAPAPAGTRVLPVHDLPYEDLGFALVDDDAHTALLLPSWPDATPFAIEAAPGSDAAALDATAELRWMKSCPTSRTECLLFGPPAAVASAVDPLEPPGGWSITTTVRGVPDAHTLPDDADTIGEGVQIAVVSENLGDDPNDDDRSICGVWATLDVGPVEVLEVFCYDTQGFTGGVFASGDLLIVWAWETERARLHFAQLDARTGAHRAPPRTAAADAYYEVDCGNVWSATRPLPVMDGAHIGIALTWGGGDALYFREGATRGRIVRAELPSDPSATDEGVSELPPVLRTARCAGRLCVRPAPSTVVSIASRW